MTVKISMLVLWVVTSCELVGRYRPFGGTYCLHLQDFSPDDGGGMFLRNVDIFYKSTWRFKPEANTKVFCSSDFAFRMLWLYVSHIVKYDDALSFRVSGGRIRMTRTRLNVGLITPHRTYLTITKTRKGRPRPDPGFSATDDDDGCLFVQESILRHRPYLGI
jgi:hypothetical protein